MNIKYDPDFKDYYDALQTAKLRKKTSQKIQFLAKNPRHRSLNFKKYNKKKIDLSGKLNIKELMALMPNLELFIANDGGPMHIAAAMKVPTIGLFGYENPRRYYPLGKNNISLYNVENHDLCDKKFLVEWPKCRNPEHIKKISVKNVEEAINKLVK